MVCITIVSILFTVFFSAGCKKKVEEKAIGPAPKKLESVYTNRMHDAVYVEALRTNRVEQSLQAKKHGPPRIPARYLKVAV